MINITLSAEERLIKLARELAAKEHTTLDAKFREWLEDYLRKEARVRYAHTGDDQGRTALAKEAVTSTVAVREKVRGGGIADKERAMACIADMRRTVRTGGRKFTRDEMNER